MPIVDEAMPSQPLRRRTTGNHAARVLITVRVAAVIGALCILATSDVPWRWRWAAWLVGSEKAGASGLEMEEVCTPVHAHAAEDYSDVYSYRMRTPDLVSTLVLIHVDPASLPSISSLQPLQQQQQQQQQQQHGSRLLSSAELYNAATVVVCHSHTSSKDLLESGDFNNLRGIGMGAGFDPSGLEHLPSQFVVHGGGGVASDLLHLANRVLKESNPAGTTQNLTVRTAGAATTTNDDSLLTQQWLRARIMHREPLYGGQSPAANRDAFWQASSAAGMSPETAGGRDGPTPFAAANLGVFSNPARHPRQSVANFVYVVGVVGSRASAAVHGGGDTAAARCRFAPVAAAAGLTGASHGLSAEEVAAGSSDHHVLSSSEDRAAAKAAAEWLLAQLG